MEEKKLKRWITICDIAFFAFFLLMVVLFFALRTPDRHKFVFLWAVLPAIVVRIASYVLRHINR